MFLNTDYLFNLCLWRSLRIKSIWFFSWNDKKERAFYAMKAIVASDCINMYPDYDKLFDIYTDTSNYQVGATIIQNGKSVINFSKNLILLLLPRFKILRNMYVMWTLMCQMNYTCFAWFKNPYWFINNSAGCHTRIYLIKLKLKKPKIFYIFWMSGLIVCRKSETMFLGK